MYLACHLMDSVLFSLIQSTLTCYKEYRSSIKLIFTFMFTCMNKNRHLSTDLLFVCPDFTYIFKPNKN